VPGLSGLRMAHNRLSPVPRQQLVEPMSRMRANAAIPLRARNRLDRPYETFTPAHARC
jgi:hypothetical protein